MVTGCINRCWHEMWGISVSEILQVWDWSETVKSRVWRYLRSGCYRDVRWQGVHREKTQALSTFQPYTCRSELRDQQQGLSPCPCFQGLSATATGEVRVPVTTALEVENGSMPTGSPTLAMFTQSFREVDMLVSSLNVLPLLGLVPGRSRH